jgi:hypothetical protein
MEEKQQKNNPYYKIMTFRTSFWNTPLIMFRPNINNDAYISQWFYCVHFRLFEIFFF